MMLESIFVIWVAVTYSFGFNEVIENAIEGTPLNAPSTAAETVPEYNIFWLVLEPLFIPDNTKSGLFSKSSWSPILTQSTGVPVHEYPILPLNETLSNKIGLCSVIEWLVADFSTWDPRTCQGHPVVPNFLLTSAQSDSPGRFIDLEPGISALGWNPVCTCRDW